MRVTTSVRASAATARAAAARDLILARTPSAQVELYSLDLASFASIRHFAAEIAERHPHIDVLINNAGAAPLTQQFTADGFEMQFGTNHLGHFALTGLLFDLIRATPQARVVTLSSGGHRFGAIDQVIVQTVSRRSLVVSIASRKVLRDPPRFVFDAAIERATTRLFPMPGFHDHVCAEPP